MKLYKQKNLKKSLNDFMFYEVIQNGTEIQIRSGTCGKKIKESIKSYEDEAKTAKAYQKMLKNKFKSDYFECEGDEHGPILTPPFSLSSSSEDFSARLSQLSNLGIYLAPYSHGRDNFEDIDPICSMSVTTEDKSIQELIAHSIMEAEPVKEALLYFKNNEMELHEYSVAQWEINLIEETKGYREWEILEPKDIDCGIFRKIDGFESVELYLDIVNNSNVKSANDLVELNSHYEEYSEIEEAIEFRQDEGYSNVNEIAKLFMPYPAKPYAQLMQWLFDDVTFSAYEITTSSFFASIGRPFAIILYLIKENKTCKSHLYFHKVMFEC